MDLAEEIRKGAIKALESKRKLVDDRIKEMQRQEPLPTHDIGLKKKTRDLWDDCIQDVRTMDLG